MSEAGGSGGNTMITSTATITTGNSELAMLIRLMEQKDERARLAQEQERKEARLAQ